MNLKKTTAILLAAALALTMAGCGSSEDEEENTIEIEDSTVYNIAVVRSADNVYINMLDQGFIDSISDQIGAEHLNVSYIIYNDEDEKLLSEYEAALAGEPIDGENADETLAEEETQNTDELQVGGAEADADEADGTEADGSSEENAAEIAKSILADYDVTDYDLVYTIGIPALQTVKTQTDTVPIVASGVVDFESALGLSTTEEKWDAKTHTNVAGVQGLPPVDQQLSVMIEATPDLEAVGIVYREDDVDAIYQNEVLEKYLDQAGIPWKEYMIPMPAEENDESDEDADVSEVTDSKSEEDLTEGKGTDVDAESETEDAETDEEAETAEDENTSVRSDDEISFYEMIFGRRYGASDKAASTEDADAQTEGDETAAEGTGDGADADTASNADSGVREPRQSALWDTYINALLAVEAEDYKQQELAAAEAAEAAENGTDGQTAETAATETTDTEIDETEEIRIKHPITELQEDADEADIIAQASSVCDMLYVSAGSYLIDDMETIGNTAIANGARTFSGDTTGGKYTLVSLYCDPYNMGYQAGKLAYKILVEEENPGELKLSSPSSSAVQKLYNGEIASLFDMTFPKSFMEINEFETTYVPGSMTTRVKN